MSDTRQSSDTRQDRPRSRQVVARLLLAVTASLSFAAPAFAQDLAADGLKVWKERGGCFNCHGDFGQGGEGGHFPAGPSLRASQLDPASMREMIACGIPGTPMPYNLKGAYIDTECYGEKGAVLEGAVPGASLEPAELDALMAYLGEKVVGKRRITKAECVEYYGDPNAVACADYR
jgi:mono/diheme cytochrome c family protein